MATADNSQHASPSEGGVSQPRMRYTCVNCAERKLRCDKLLPKCSRCLAGNLECINQILPPRGRRKKLSSDISNGMVRQERNVHQQSSPLRHSILHPSAQNTPLEPRNLPPERPNTSKTGEVLTSQGKSRYVDSSLWRNLGDNEMLHTSDDEDENQTVPASVDSRFTSDPLSGTFVGSHESLSQYHPTQSDALLLWQTFVENVEPICKILHIPSTVKTFEVVSSQPTALSKVDECLLFAIYHFAVFSITEEECLKRFGHPRGILMQQYQYATSQALVNASFLRSTKMPVLQALVLFLIPCTYCFDSHTYWMLTGVAVRTAQRMGLQRDGIPLNLSPFDTEMRRRLFYQIIQLDRVASQLSGIGICIMPNSWDTKPPLNVNDDKVNPEMTEAPEEQNGATDMIFYLARVCISEYFAKAGGPTQGDGFWQFKNYSEAERFIREAEKELEERFIRYCDVMNPLHFLTICLCRSAITAMHLRARLPKASNQTITDIERRELFHLSLRIIETDITTSSQPSLAKYLWNGMSFWLPGSLNSFIFILNSLVRTDLLSIDEKDNAWTKVGQIYNIHKDVLKLKRALHTALMRLTLKAWSANPPSVSAPIPDFIDQLGHFQKSNPESGIGIQSSNGSALGDNSDVLPTFSWPPTNNDTFFGGSSDDFGPDLGNDSSFNVEDWTFWG